MPDAVVLTDAYVYLNGSFDASPYLKEVRLPYSADALEDTAMGDDTHSSTGGLKAWSVTLQAFNSHVAAELDSFLFPLVGTKIAVLIRPKSDAKGADNPEFTGTALLEGYEPLSGAVGALAMTPITLRAASTLARAVA